MQVNSITYFQLMTATVILSAPAVNVNGSFLNPACIYLCVADYVTILENAGYTTVYKTTKPHLTLQITAICLTIF